VEVRSDANRILVFDGGTGIRNLGQALRAEFRNEPIAASIFLTHYHWDHIQGIPFFLPLYRPENEITFRTSQVFGSCEERLMGQMSQPYFPVSLDEVGARRHFQDFPDGLSIPVGDVLVRPFPLNHPQGACGYRVESPRAAVVYATDLEHGHPRLDQVLREYSHNADILIYDAQYTPHEYQSHTGWGHSTWEEATRVARDAGVKHLILFHHDPWHNDLFMEEVVEQARQHFENTSAAMEGWSTDI
jgi:phosphoribosyl 1,2-cyclic phosphodiesterase